MGLGLGPFELILIFGVLLLLFGAKRLPELAGGMGKGIRDFKRALHSPDDEPNASVLQAQAPAPAALPETAA
ncbi:MAG TPA: twin-arginine translocase TatA/TatE family subunit, partial [Longimicrobium sp.]|nr:twin-arginine translocase TatA/TatE family subunit [Longimicrobium sp.]